MNAKTGIELIVEERREQIEKHGYDSNHDELHDDNATKTTDTKNNAFFILKLLVLIYGTILFLFCNN